MIIVRRRSRLAPAHSFPLLGVSTPRSKQVQGPLRGCVGPTGSDPALFPPGTGPHSVCGVKPARRIGGRTSARPIIRPFISTPLLARVWPGMDSSSASADRKFGTFCPAIYQLFCVPRRLADAFAESAALQGGTTECITLVSSAGGPGPCLVPSPGWQDRCREVDSERIPRGKCFGHGK